MKNILGEGYNLPGTVIDVTDWDLSETTNLERLFENVKNVESII